MSDEVWKPVARDEEGREYPGYEVSDRGNYRSVDRTLPGGRRVKGRPLTVRTSNRGYGLVDLRDADGNKVTRSAHKPVLETHHKLCPPGQEARHLDDNGLNNRFVPAATAEESRRLGGNLWWGDKDDQHRDKVRNGGAKPPPGPSYDCLNHEKCKGKVKTEGRRCLPCVEQVGRDAADMLRSGENLLKVVQHFGYSGTRWTYQLAVKHGGYTGTEAQALTQKRSWLRRVTATVRDRRPRGDKASPARSAIEGTGGRNPRPRALRAVSPVQSLGQARTIKTPSVAERNGPKVAERDRVVPLPADLALRNRPAKPRKSGRTRLGDKTS
jgi:NUMOD4 motif